ncbi:MAG: tRNA-dependent cyclodipeptide synthase [Oligoflexia bacterium]|nr:tRNA-dependent cyclodipeptide synthase [Oligoflexia bacterium]
MIIQGLTPSCENVLANKTHVCFGISPFNSYFSETKIEELARWGKKQFQSMHFFIPDEPSVYTLQAIGYDQEKAEWKSRRQSQYILNKITKALRNLGVCFSEIDNYILNWENLSCKVQFQNRYLEIKNKFEEDTGFKKACLEAAEWVLEGKLKNGPANEQQTFLAVKYLLAEIPIFLYSPEILNVRSSIFCYHQYVPFVKNLMDGHFSCQKDLNQGFVIVKSQSEVNFTAGEVLETTSF